MAFRRLARVLALGLTVTLSACDSNDPGNEPAEDDLPRTVAEADFVVTASGLKYHDFVEGQGGPVEDGTLVTVHYTGWVASTNEKFDSSRDRGQPFTFVYSADARLIEGWKEGVSTMRAGGDRQLVIPPALGYGAGGNGPIPPNATLIFEIEVLGVN